jgi:hypothetical protein
MSFDIRDPRDVAEAVENFLSHNGVGLAGPVTLRLSHTQEAEQQWSSGPRLVLEADLR